VNHKCSFVPHVQAMPVSAGEIVIVNSDPILHNTMVLREADGLQRRAPEAGLRIPKPPHATGARKG